MWLTCYGYIDLPIKNIPFKNLIFILQHNLKATLFNGIDSLFSESVNILSIMVTQGFGGRKKMLLPVFMPVDKEVGLYAWCICS